MRVTIKLVSEQGRQEAQAGLIERPKTRILDHRADTNIKEPERA